MIFTHILLCVHSPSSGMFLMADETEAVTLIRNRPVIQFGLRRSLIDQTLQGKLTQITGHHLIEPRPHGQGDAETAAIT